MTVGIYGIFDASTNECLYVGLSRNIEERWKSHIKTLSSGRHIRKEFVQWFEENGSNPNSMRFEILEECIDDDTVKNLAEIKWFNKLSPLFYAKKPAINERWTLSEETKSKISKSMSERRPRKIYDYICKGCSITFSDAKRNRTYCSNSCKSSSFSKIEITEDLREKLFDMYVKQKMNLHAIGDKLEVSHVMVYNLLESYGIPRRGRSKAGIVNEYIPSFTYIDAPRAQKAGKISAHNRWHAARDIVNPDCDVCVSETVESLSIA